MGDRPAGIAPKCDTWLGPAVLHSTYIWVVHNSVKKAGVCAVMSMWLVHIKDHLWTIGFMPNHRASNSSKTRLGQVMMASGLTRWVCCMRQHPCLLPRELRWEEVAPPQKLVRDSRLARTNNWCKALPNHLVRMGL